ELVDERPSTVHEPLPDTQRRFGIAAPFGAPCPIDVAGTLPQSIERTCFTGLALRVHDLAMSIEHRLLHQVAVQSESSEDVCTKQPPALDRGLLHRPWPRGHR